MSGWLVQQLPQTMARDPVIAGFVTAFEQIAESIRDRMSTVEHELDVDLASPEMLSYLAAWLGVELSTISGYDEGPRSNGARGGRHAVELREAARDRDAQRRLIRAVGQVLGWRGTRQGLEVLLEALTGGRVEVSDSGGVFGQHDPLPPPDDLVRIVLDDTGSLTGRQLLAFIADELPVGVRVEVRVRSGQGSIYASSGAEG